MTRRKQVIEAIERERAGVVGDSPSQLLRLATISILNGISIQDVMDENEKIADIVLKSKRNANSRHKP